MLLGNVIRFAVEVEESGAQARRGNAGCSQFSQPVIRGLGVVVVDADRSDTSRALVEQVAASPNLSIAARARQLAYSPLVAISLTSTVTLRANFDHL